MMERMCIIILNQNLATINDAHIITSEEMFKMINNSICFNCKKSTNMNNKCSWARDLNARNDMVLVTRPKFPKRYQGVYYKVLFCNQFELEENER